MSLAEVPVLSRWQQITGQLNSAHNIITTLILKSYTNYIDTLSVNKSKISCLLSLEQYGRNSIGLLFLSMVFFFSSCAVLRRLRAEVKLGDGRTESCPAEKDLGILMGKKLDMSQQYDLAAHIFPLYSVLVRPQLKVCVQLWSPVTKKVWTCWSSSEKDHENGQRAGAPLLWQKPERVAVVQLGKGSMEAFFWPFNI